jgi:hypothetical protein
MRLACNKEPALSILMLTLNVLGPYYSSHQRANELPIGTFTLQKPQRFKNLDRAM